MLYKASRSAWLTRQPGYTIKFTNCLQCDLDRTYPLDKEQDGSSYPFAKAESNLVDLHAKCVQVYGSDPTANVTLTEPPLWVALQGYGTLTAAHTRHPRT